MSMSSDGILAYGYDLGGPEGWEIENTTDRWGHELPVDWYDPDDVETDFAGAAMNHLLAAAGFTETDWRADGYFERKRAAEANLEVQVVTHCSIDYPLYVLAAWSIEAYRGYPKAIDLAEFGHGTRLLWDARLAYALKVLDLTPKQAEPALLLCSLYG